MKKYNDLKISELLELGASVSITFHNNVKAKQAYENIRKVTTADIECRQRSGYKWMETTDGNLEVSAFYRREEEWNTQI